MPEIPRSLLDGTVAQKLAEGKQYKFPDISFVIYSLEDKYKIEQPLHLDIERDFATGLTDLINVTFTLPMGDYRDFLLKNRDKLAMVIKWKYEDGSTLSKTYRFFISTVDNNFRQSTLDNVSKGTLNTMDLVTVKGQCVDPIIMDMRQYIVNGIYKKVTLDKVIKYLFAEYLDKAKVLGGSVSYKINMDKLDNETEYNHVIIKSRTKLVKLPYYFQTGDYGLYNGGVNTYVEHVKDNNYIIRIYPIYDYTKVDKFERSYLNIFNPMQKTLGLNEITYKFTPKFCKNKEGAYDVVCTNVELQDRGKTNIASNFDTLYNVNPFTLADPKARIVTDKEVKYKTDKLAVLEKYTKNDTASKNYLYTNVEGNLYKYRALLLKNDSKIAKFVFPKFDETILYPGMMINYYYSKDNKAIRERGVIHKTVTTYNFTKQSSATAIFAILENLDNNVDMSKLEKE
jgi:hypothetical protein